MVVFKYDKTFEGLLTCVFDAYFRKTFPEHLFAEDEILPLFCEEVHSVVSDTEKSERVWRSLEKKLSKSALSCLTVCWMADGHPHRDELLFRYLCKAVDAQTSIELNFGDPDVLEVSKIYKQVSYERMRIMQFLRFQKASDGTYFAVFEPVHNALPLAIAHFRDRFADQKWVIYDLKRQYGYYYDLKTVEEITFTDQEAHLLTGFLDEGLAAEDEKLFQSMWKSYYKAISIKERYNPRKHRQDMPVRYWKYLTEKQ